MQNNADSQIVIGQINGIYGTQGWVKVFSYTQPIGNILQYQPWLVKKDGAWLELRVINSHKPVEGKAIVVQLEGLNDRDLAREYMGAEVAILRSQLPEDDAYYWVDLIGCQVINQDQQQLGKVSEMIETGAHDVMRIQQADRQVLIPFVRDVYVLAVDLEQQQILVDWELETD